MGPVPGAIAGAINPPEGLSRWQGAGAGFVNGIPIARIISSFLNTVNGNLGTGNNPVNNLFRGSPVGPQLPTTSETNNPPMYGPPQFPTNSETNNPPGGNPSAPAGPAADGGELGPGGIPRSVWDKVFQTGRFTNAPAFTPTLAQLLFPGSAIGPLNAVTNPYNQNARRAPVTHVTGIPGDAAAWMNYVRSRNQL